MSGLPFTTTEVELQPILAELQRREPIFHRPEFASTQEDFARLMAPNYWEVGASGSRYSAEFIQQHLAQNKPDDAEAVGWQTSGFACRALGPDTFLLTYTLAQGDRRTRRATIWHRSDEGWQIIYHQGTVITISRDDVEPEGEDHQPHVPKPEQQP